jgi:hypothetical protein
MTVTTRSRLNERFACHSIMERARYACALSGSRASELGRYAHLDLLRGEAL